MERKIGEKFKFKEKTLIVVESDTCEECFFFDLYCRVINHINNITGWCFNR